MIRLANVYDLTGVCEVIDDAKALFKSEGSDQWQDTDNYPNRQTMLNDILRNELYVYIKDEKVVGCVCLSSILELCYENIYDGKWLTDGPYLVIHRISVRNGYYRQGIAKALIEEMINVAIRKKVSSIKVDTKIGNIRMINLLKHFGFVITGKINLLRKDVLDKVRVTLEKVL